MPHFKRDITLQLASRIKENRPLIQVLIGPRQVGKTTAVQQVISELSEFHSIYAAADLPAPPDFEWIRSHWQEARDHSNEKPVILVLDEVQKVSGWSEEVKRLWDEDKNAGRDIRVIILGSAALLLQKGLTESLAGRFELNRAFHWSFSECARCFGWDLDTYVYFGGYPGAAPFIQDEKRWSAYVRDSLIETAISKDVLMMNPVEKPALLRKLFVLACEYGGQILSYQKVMGQLVEAGNTTTIANYQRLLESAFLIAGLEKYSGSRVRQRSSSPKWLPLNTGLISALSNKSFSDIKAEPSLRGRWIECVVGIHLFNEAAREGFELFYWRKGNFEVDYVASKGQNLLAIEVKSGVKKLAVSGLKAFQREYGSGKSIIVGNSGIPIIEFLNTSILKLT